MVQVRLLGSREEIDEMVKSFEKTYDIAHKSEEYTRSNNPKYQNRKDVRVYLEMSVKK
ncbi:YvzF family protein [Bacillus sp. CGMCC 1.16541]|uniref:YvzF family protein n=1 Tax=Bacillus sp. CGMCC 1.16541 TaxID=2185143 RepID=UPI000D726B9D|nr:YvzF family protein [Bacillus sp. CGMCC 1.16541]